MQKETQLTTEEKIRACQVAAIETKKRQSQFIPNSPVLKDKDGFVCQHTYKGRSGDEIMCSILLQWLYPSSGAFGRLYQAVHVKLKILQKPEGRFLRVINFHKPTLNEKRECTTCGEAFNENDIILPDTSLHEY